MQTDINNAVQLDSRKVRRAVPLYTLHTILHYSIFCVVKNKIAVAVA